MSVMEKRRTYTPREDLMNNEDGNVYSNEGRCSVAVGCEPSQYAGSKADELMLDFQDNRNARTPALSRSDEHCCRAKGCACLESDKCGKVRFIATRWLSRLMHEFPDASNLLASQGHKCRRWRQQQPPWVCEGSHIVDEKGAQVIGRGDGSIFPSKGVLFVDVVRKGTLPAARSSEVSHPEGDQNSERCDASLALWGLEPKDGALPELGELLKEVVLACTSSAPGFSLVEKGGETVAVSCAERQETAEGSLEAATASSVCCGGSCTENELAWRNVRKILCKLRHLVEKHSELIVELNTTVGSDWQWSDDDSQENITPLKDDNFHLPPSQVSCCAENVSHGTSSEGELGGDAQEGHNHNREEEQEQVFDGSTAGVSFSGTRLNRDAPPFHSRLNLSAYVSPSSTIAAGMPASFESNRVFNKGTNSTNSPLGTSVRTLYPEIGDNSNNNNAVMGSGDSPTVPLFSKVEAKLTSTSPISTLGSSTSSPGVTFNLESREGMLRRRTAAAAANHYGHGASVGYYGGGRSRSGWCNAISPGSSYVGRPMPHLPCPFDYILVVDFEATCEENAPPSYLHEIIEFPVVVVDVKLQRVITEFHRYVRPKFKSQLSDFCRALTGIQQDDIDSASLLEDVIKQFERWYAQTIPPGSRVVLATDGPADMREFMYVHSVTRQGIRFPNLFYQWIDVKQIFAHFFQCQQGKIKAMLEVLHCPFEGRLHSGIDDARNIAKIVIRMLEVGCSFCEIPLCRLPYGTTAVVNAEMGNDT
uniref:Exonuclease domain-containing protein n=1 Tax=Trypanosoma congolense (strain IL3000) TaxID=1068625 RepID=G0UKH5_TRYCI|nr:conserved hypothetical protein [Trypanosoma congolense IL3000]